VDRIGWIVWNGFGIGFERCSIPNQLAVPTSNGRGPPAELPLLKPPVTLYHGYIGKAGRACLVTRAFGYFVSNPAVARAFLVAKQTIRRANHRVRNTYSETQVSNPYPTGENRVTIALAIWRPINPNEPRYFSDNFVAPKAHR
jgi:hypothetical protein